MKYAIVFLFLTACAPAMPVFKPIDVEVPIAVPCQTALVSKPNFALNHVSAADNIAQKTKAALSELNQRRAYEDVLESQIASCQ